LLRTRFPKESETPFIITPEGRSLPYSAVDELTARLAGALQRLGLARGERLVMLIDKSPEAILLYLAVLRLGAILVPVNTAYTAREFRYFLNDAKPKNDTPDGCWWGCDGGPGVCRHRSSHILVLKPSVRSRQRSGTTGSFQS